MNLVELTKNQRYVKMLQCGAAGAGKTCGASTFPRPLYYIDCEKGIKSLLPFYDYDQSRLAGIEFDNYLDDDLTNPTAFTRIEQKITEWLYMEEMPFKTVVIDSLATLEDKMLNRILHDIKTKRVLGTANQQDYGILIWGIKSFIQKLLALQCHVVVNCHIQIIQHELTKQILVLPLVTGKKLPHMLPIWFDEIYHVVVKADGKHFWQIRPVEASSFTIARTRTLPKSAPDFIEQDFNQLAKYLNLAS